jgi:hypothetical protein
MLSVWVGTDPQGIFAADSRSLPERGTLSILAGKLGRKDRDYSF